MVFWIGFCGLTICTIVFGTETLNQNDALRIILRIILIVLFVSFVVLSLMKMRIDYRVTQVLSYYHFEIYTMQGIMLTLFRTVWKIDNPAVYIVYIMLVTAFLIAMINRGVEFTVCMVSVESPYTKNYAEQVETRKTLVIRQIVNVFSFWTKLRDSLKEDNQGNLKILHMKKFRMLFWVLTMRMRIL